MIPQPDIGLVSRFERWVRNRSVVAGGVGVLVGVQFKDAATREFRLIGRHLRGDDGRALACHLQLHPQVAHRTSRAERTAVTGFPASSTSTTTATVFG